VANQVEKSQAHYGHRRRAFLLRGRTDGCQCLQGEEFRCISPCTHWGAETGARAAELFALRCADLNLQLGDGTGVATIRRRVLFEGKEFTTKSNKVRGVPIDASVVDVLKKHLNGRRDGHVFQTRKGTALRESDILPDLHDLQDELGIPRAGGRAFGCQPYCRTP